MHETALIKALAVKDHLIPLQPSESRSVELALQAHLDHAGLHPDRVRVEISDDHRCCKVEIDFHDAPAHLVVHEAERLIFLTISHDVTCRDNLSATPVPDLAAA